MASPIPPIALSSDQCSVIDNGVLYVYSPTAFQSLPLKSGAKWSKLQNGVASSGAACVLGQDPSSGDNALWVVGGSSPNQTYPGLQKYSFAKRAWSTISPLVKVTQNRRGHAAVFLKNSSQILIYAGSQQAPVPSTETFLISLTAPYLTESFTSRNTPALSPQLLPWDADSAVTIGGAANDKNIYRFKSGKGWSRYKTSLQLALKPATEERATLVQGADGSKVLELYDLSISPGYVDRVVLQNANGRPAQSGQSVGGPSRKRKRDLTLKTWPKYNSTFAPTSVRTGFSLAQSDDGQVVLVGGNAQNPVEIFDQQKNTWLDTANFFGLNDVHGQNVLGVSTSSASPTSTSSPTSTPTPDTGSHPNTSKILGAVLGSILGFILLLILALLFMHYRRKKRAPPSEREGDEKQRLSFADQGAPFMKEAGGAINYPKELSNRDTLAMLGAGKAVANHRRSGTHGSDSSTARLVHKKSSQFGMNEAMEMETIREKSRDSSPQSEAKLTDTNLLLTAPKRSSGWSRYFSGADFLSIGTGNSKRGSSTQSTRGSGSNLGVAPVSQRKSGLSASETVRSSSNNHDCNTHGPTELPPLELGQQFMGSRVSRVVTGAPAITPLTDMAESNLDWPSRPQTVSSTFSSIRPSTAGDTIFTREHQDEPMTAWTPVTRSDWTSIRPRDTGSSSVYEINADSNEALPINNSTAKFVFPKPQSATVHHVSKFSDATTMLPSTRPVTEASNAGFDQARTATPLTHKRSISGTHTTIMKMPEKAFVNSDASWLDLNPTSPKRG